MEDRRNISRHLDKLARSYSSDSNDGGFPPSRSTNSSKSNSPVLLSSSSRESSNSNSPVLRATALYGKLEPAGISSDSGSSDFEPEHNIHERIAHRIIQSESNTENYKLYKAKSPTMKSTLSNEIHNGISIRPLPNSANNRRIQIAVNESTDTYLEQNRNAVSATTRAPQHNKVLTTSQILNGSQEYNETSVDQNKTQIVDRTFAPAIEKSGFTGLRPLARQSVGSVSKINDSNNYIPSSSESLGLPLHNSAVKRKQWSVHEIDTAVSPGNLLTHSGSSQSDFSSRNKTNGYLTGGTTEYLTQSRTQNSDSLHPSMLRRSYHGKGFHDNAAGSPTSDHDVTFAVPLTTVERAGLRTVRAAGPRTPPRITIVSNFVSKRDFLGCLVFKP